MGGKIMYLYESHTGGVFVSEDILELDYCEMCGDYDRNLGSFQNMAELVELMQFNGYAKDYISENLVKIIGFSTESGW